MAPAIQFPSQIPDPLRLMNFYKDIDFAQLRSDIKIVFAAISRTTDFLPRLATRQTDIQDKLSISKALTKKLDLDLLRLLGRATVAEKEQRHEAVVMNVSARQTREELERGWEYQLQLIRKLQIVMMVWGVIQVDHNGKGVGERGVPEGGESEEHLLTRAMEEVQFFI